MLFGINLLPQEDRFYDLVGESGELAYRSVKLLSDLVIQDDWDKAYKLGHDIETAKARAKEVNNEITAMLCRTFITPLDREDINALTYDLYKIPKMTEKAQKRILAFQLQPFQNDFQRLTNNMQEAAEPLDYLIKNLKTLKVSQSVHDKCDLLDTIENNTDELLSQLLVDLFREEEDVKQVVLRKDMYELMENIVDTHRDIGNTLLEIVLKHS